MIVRGLIRSADLEERPPGSDRIEMVLRVQGVGPGQPRLLIVPHELLLDDPTLDPEQTVGRSFAAEVAQDVESRWVVSQIVLAGRVLREET
jgi:hypothetical protein